MFIKKDKSKLRIYMGSILYYNDDETDFLQKRKMKFHGKLSSPFRKKSSFDTRASCETII